jgi:hypothetical protein
MSTHDVERELTALLHRHAEDAMTDTNTSSELDKFQRSAGGPAHPDRRRRIAIGAAIVGAAAVTAVTIWAAGQDSDRSQPDPMDTSHETSPDRAVARAFVAAYADHDIQAASAYVAEGTEPWPDWDTESRRNAAWKVEYLVDGCRGSATSTGAVAFTCPYDLHLLASEEVGLGPYPDSYFQVVVRDGEVTSASSTIPYQTNGVGNHVEEVTRWVRENHPADADFLLKEEQAVTEAEWPRWTRLWHEVLREYVDQASRGGSS